MVIVVFNYEMIKVNYWYGNVEETHILHTLVPLYPNEVLINGFFFDYKVESDIS